MTVSTSDPATWPRDPESWPCQRCGKPAHTHPADILAAIDLACGWSAAVAMESARKTKAAVSSHG